jgi:transcriptional regulator with XRE-family HTH domain
MGNDRDDERIGATLRQFREMRGLKADDLATRMGISRAYLANIEAGRKRLTPVLLARAAAELHVPQIAVMRASDEAA